MDLRSPWQAWSFAARVPRAKAVFLTLEDEFGRIPLVVWPQVYDQYRLVLREPVLLVLGLVSRREGTMNVVAQQARSVRGVRDSPKSKDRS